MNTAQWKMNTSVGPLYLVASSAGLQSIYWQKKSEAPFIKSLNSSKPEIKILALAVKQLGEYFKGIRTEFQIPFDVQGTTFQKCVWKELSKIPFGKTCSYRDIAHRIRHEKAVRAVGTANGRNPLSIMVPCHRVIATDGSLGGYAGGLHVKTQLLELESHHLSQHST